MLICILSLQEEAFTLGEKCVPEGDRPENSVRNGDLLWAESVLQVVVVGVGKRLGTRLGVGQPD